ncbi:MAG TPA: helix-hairpin-helix domain-containing protein [Fulvivirga sp.]|nr:helix-hairpin-helix domain-containing protein [Fulvivirga sp.]
MNRLNHWIRSYFGFSKSEANGMIVLIPLAFSLLISPYIYQAWVFKPIENQLDIDKLDSLVAVMKKNIYIDSAQRREEFYKAHQFAKFNTKRFEKIERESPVIYSHRKFKRKLEMFDINVADTITLKEIPGIGPTISKRIIKYRESLGGFVSKNQFKDIFGLQDSVLLALDTLAVIEDDFIPKQIEVNTLNEHELSKHPYIGRSLARSIIAYEFQHGKMQGPSDLENIKLIDSLRMIKILPYLKFNP